MISECIESVEFIAYEDLGAGALQKMAVEDFPATVVIDCMGNNLYETGPQEYKK